MLAVSPAPSTGSSAPCSPVWRSSPAVEKMKPWSASSELSVIPLVRCGHRAGILLLTETLQKDLVINLLLGWLGIVSQES